MEICKLKKCFYRGTIGQKLPHGTLMFLKQTLTREGLYASLYARLSISSRMLLISELIFKKVATEIEYILRLSKLKEYVSH